MTLRSNRLYTLLGCILIVSGAVIGLYPFFPSIHYRLTHLQEEPAPIAFSESDFLPDSEDVEGQETPTEEPSAPAPTQQNRPTGGANNTLKIEKIGVSMPIVEGSVSALERGAWRLPLSATPGHIGNTIISAHRYKYLPPSSKTFYLLDKLKVGDTFTITWEGKTYRYGIDTREIRAANDLDMLKDTFDRRVTLITCNPLFSTKERLIVSGRQLK